MKKLIALAAALAVLASFASCTATTTDTPKDTEGTTTTVATDEKTDVQTLTMATNASFPPYEYVDGGKIVGIDAEIAEAIAKLEEKFAGEGRVLIRPSGTEPKVRVMIEGKDKNVIDEEAQKLADLIHKTMV